MQLPNAQVIRVASVMAMAMEAVNTCIERVCDRITTKFDSDIRAAKHMASFACFLCTGYLITLFTWSVLTSIRFVGPLFVDTAYLI